MNGVEARERIRKLLVDAGKIAKEYGTDNYFSASMHLKEGHIEFMNAWWDEDEKCPIRYLSFGEDFGQGEDK